MMAALLQGLRSLGALRAAAIGMVGLAVLGFLLFATLRGGRGPMTPLGGDLDLRESAQAAAALDKLRIPYQLTQGGQILVPMEEAPRARIALAREGLPAGGMVGYEIFDRGDGLGTSQFQQQMNQLRALEGELARSIRTLAGVRAARVHLVLPRREPFARDRQEARASVVLALAGAARLDRDQTRAIVNLLTGAVPGLAAQNVAVVDSQGHVLAENGQISGGETGATATRAEQRRAAERQMARSVEELLERTLGSGQVRAEVALDYDYDRVNETEERFDPDGQVMRSQQSVSEQSRSTEQTSSTSVQNNLPNPESADAGRTGTQESRQEETTNYEISRSVRTVVRDQPVLRRLSLAVMVAHTAERGVDGATIWRARTPAELERIAAIVRPAVGFDERRGDRVEVASMAFVTPPAADEAGTTGLFGLDLERAELFRIGETALAIGLFLIFIYAFARPTVARLVALNPHEPPPALAAVAMPVPTPLPPLEEAMVSMAQVDGQVRAASLRALAGLVDERPQEAVQTLRNWLATEPA